MSDEASRIPSSTPQSVHGCEGTLSYSSVFITVQVSFLQEQVSPQFTKLNFCVAPESLQPDIESHDCSVVCGAVDLRFQTCLSQTHDSTQVDAGAVFIGKLYDVFEGFKSTCPAIASSSAIICCSADCSAAYRAEVSTGADG